MNQAERVAHLEAFKTKIDELDAQAEVLEEEERAEYEITRNNFRGLLRAWADLSESEWDEFKGRLDEKYRELEAKFPRVLSG